MDSKVCRRKDCINSGPQPLSAFHTNRWKKDGYYNICKVCHAKECLVAQTKYKKKNAKLLSQKAMANAKKNYSNTRKNANNWYKNNRDKVKRKNADYVRRNSHKVNAYMRKRDADKLQRTPKWLTKDDFKFIELFYKEAARLTKETKINYEVDHIVPLQGKIVSGLHVPWNLQVITESENCHKHNKFE